MTEDVNDAVVRAARLVAIGCLAIGLAGAGLIGCGEFDVGDGGEPGDDASNGDGAGGDQPVPVEGSYRVVSQTRNDEGCDEEGTPRDADDYFALEQVAEDRSAIGYFPCSSSSDCEASGEPRMVFDELYEEEQRWRGTALDWEENGSSCELGRTESIVDLDGGDVEVQHRAYAGKMEDAEACDEELAEEQQANLICEQYEVITAVPLE